MIHPQYRGDANVMLGFSVKSQLSTTSNAFAAAAAEVAHSKTCSTFKTAVLLCLAGRRGGGESRRRGGRVAGWWSGGVARWRGNGMGALLCFTNAVNFILCFTEERILLIDTGKNAATYDG